MKNIIGNPGPKFKRFKCDRCGCLFESDEYIVTGYEEDYNSACDRTFYWDTFGDKCPNCGNLSKEQK